MLLRRVVFLSSRPHVHAFAPILANTRPKEITLNKRNTLYWILTGLMSAFMVMGAIVDVLRSPGALAWFVHLGYPSYLLPFLGTAKLLGVIAVLSRGTTRLKEWAYAGLVFDLLGAFYSHVSVGDSVSGWIFAVIGLLLVTGSYVTYRTRTVHEATYTRTSEIGNQVFSR